MEGQPRLADILSSLSHALDLVEGQPMGHAVRTCLISMRVAEHLDLSEKQKEDLYFAALLKDAGCSSNSVRIQAIFGDDHAAKYAVKMVDWTRKLDCILFGLKNTYPGYPPLKRFAKMIEAASDSEASMDAVTKARCSRGAQIALQLGFGSEVAEAVRSLDEHWDGKGAPEHLSGEQIPILSRILCLGQTLDVLLRGLGTAAAFRVIKKRSGRWFDPTVVAAALKLEKDADLLRSLEVDARDNALQLASPATVMEAADATIDEVCHAFASIIDAKSSFTSEHSERVMRYSVMLGEALGYEPVRLTTLRRAALLHDIGKLGVPTAILDKPGRLTEEEFDRVKLHPRHTREILGLIGGFGRITEIAAAHHERLDGRGYHVGLTAEQLDQDMRILAVADVYDALSAERPYRAALPPGEVFEIMERDAGSSLDHRLVGLINELAQGTLQLAA